jgi:hypothetical protein
MRILTILLLAMLFVTALVVAHQEESCLDGCTYYVVREGAADVHYVDARGKEISPEVALAAVGERPAAN